MSAQQQIAVVGAGLVGLSCALWLQRQGCQVSLYERDQPGMAASYGNAGLFADYAKLPFARKSMLYSMPRMLLDKHSPLSIQPSYLGQLIRYGWHFTRACAELRYREGQRALAQLIEQAPEASRQLLADSGAETWVEHQGCLGLFSTQQAAQAAAQGDLKLRSEAGVVLELVDRQQAQSLEPQLANFHHGGVFYPETRFSTSPIDISRDYLARFIALGGELINEPVTQLHSSSSEVVVQSQSGSRVFSQLVVAAGVASKALLKPLGLKLPLVSERGYHLMLEAPGVELTRPVGWLDKAIFLTPMQQGIRVAGAAEFAHPDAPINHTMLDNMHQQANTMLGVTTKRLDSWVGCRPSTPDSLPFIGPLEQHPRVTLAVGHGHLGLTLAAITGQLVAQNMLANSPAIDLAPFKPERFNHWFG